MKMSNIGRNKIGYKKFEKQWVALQELGQIQLLKFEPEE